jgi:DNA-binding CsgD family transcriptional regulator
MAKELGDEETLAHALNNVGTVQLRVYLTRQKGMELVQQSLDIALQNGYEEQAIRAFINLGSNAVVMKDYVFAKKILDQGIEYCEGRDLDLGTPYLLSFKARLHLEAGEWKEAERITCNLIKNESQPGVVKIGALIVLASIKMRRGDIDTLPLLLEAREKTLKTMEPQRIMPLMSALMEYEWITGKSLLEDALLNDVVKLCDTRGNMNESSIFAFWLLKARKQKLAMKEIYEGYKPIDAGDVLKAAAFWKQLGCPYEQALVLFEGGDENKREAIEIVRKIGADAIYEKMKFEMRASGIKNIPRGIRKTTRANTAHLTERELDVLQLLKEGLQNKEIAGRLFISPKTVDHHISAIFFKLDVKSRSKAVQEAIHLEILK